MTTIVKRDRRLGKDDDVFSQNAWDDAEWTEEMRQEAEARIEQQKAGVCENQKEKILNVENSVGQNWNDFYGIHEDKFFKDRKWIFSEFPEILERLQQDSPPCNILEVGCGVGNAVAHIIMTNKNPNLHVYCCDISDQAIGHLKERKIYADCANQITAFPTDICNAFEGKCSNNFPVEPASLDFIMLVFTLSAFKPELMSRTINNLTRLLKPNGMFLIRDYARYDMTQLRFKSKSYLSENYYVRNDGTTSYFFTREFLDNLFMRTNSLERIELKNDNRILVNRLKSLKMCRCWIQAKYRKLP